MNISVENEKKLVKEILLKIGVAENHAEIITEATLDSDLKDSLLTDLEDSLNISEESTTVSLKPMETLKL